MCVVLDSMRRYFAMLYPVTISLHGVVPRNDCFREGLPLRTLWRTTNPTPRLTHEPEQAVALPIGCL